MKKLLTVSSFLAIVVGGIMIAGGVWGIVFTYNNVARENITTPGDASIANAPVRGPFTLRAQAEIIRLHVLKTTNGATYSEMPQKIVKTDEEGQPVLDANGEAIMVSNEGRSIWLTATTLMTALNLAIITYVFSSLIILLGFISIWTGITFFFLRKGFAIESIK